MYEQQTDEVNQEILRIDLQDYTSGVYLLTVKAGGFNRISKTFVVSRR